MSAQDVLKMTSKALEFLENWQLPEALQLYKEITSLAPDNAEAWNGLCKLNTMQGQYEQAASSCRKAAALLPGSAEPLANLANSLVQLQKHNEAAGIYKQLVKLDPGSAVFTYALGTSCLTLGQLEAAADAFRKTLELNPDHADCHFNLGLIVSTQRDYPAAANHFRIVLRLNSNHAQAHYRLASALQATGKYREALEHYETAIKIVPAFVDAHFGRANVLILLAKTEEAIKSLRNVLRLNPEHVNAYADLATATLAYGRVDEAMEYCERALQINPNHATAIALSATIEHRTGKSKQALARLQPWIDRGIHNANIAIAYAEASKALDNPCDSIDIIERFLVQNHTLPATNQCHLHFHLGHLHDKTGQFAQAFDHYRQANALKPVQYDPSANTRLTDAIITVHNSAAMSVFPHARIKSHRPVFIVGMPRSGTSLVEQILSSHPLVYGAGELEDITQIINHLPQTLGCSNTYPQYMSALSQEAVDSLSQQYLAHIASLTPNAARAVDKMPGNFRFLGMIELLFPEACIVHCVRNPLDTCLSNYFQNFAGHHDYAYDLGHLATYYKDYQRLMAHWKNVLEIPIMDVIYEELIENQEAISRNLVEFCGLEWDENCLTFHESKRFVATSSYDQVRRPLYKKSVARWKHYDQQIGPLIEALKQETEAHFS